MIRNNPADCGQAGGDFEDQPDADGDFGEGEKPPKNPPWEHHVSVMRPSGAVSVLGAVSVAMARDLAVDDVEGKEAPAEVAPADTLAEALDSQAIR